MWLINALIGLISGLFVGLLIGIYVSRSRWSVAVAEGIAKVMVKRQQQNDSVIARYTNQSIEQLIDSVADSIEIGGFTIPGAMILNDHLPGFKKWILKTAKKNPEAAMYSAGRTLGPFLLGMYSQKKQNLEIDAVKQMLLNSNVMTANYNNPHVNTVTHGPKDAEVPQGSLIPPTGETHGPTQTETQ